MTPTCRVELRCTEHRIKDSYSYEFLQFIKVCPSNFILHLIFLTAHCAYPEFAHMPPKPNSTKRKADHLDKQAADTSKSTAVPGPDNTSRPVRSNRGQGGRVEQLATFEKQLGKKQMGSTTATSKAQLPADVSVNPLAPLEKKRRVAFKPKQVRPYSFHYTSLLRLSTGY